MQFLTELMIYTAHAVIKTESVIIIPTRNPRTKVRGFTFYLLLLHSSLSALRLGFPEVKSNK